MNTELLTLAKEKHPDLVEKTKMREGEDYEFFQPNVGVKKNLRGNDFSFYCSDLNNVLALASERKHIVVQCYMHTRGISLLLYCSIHKEFHAPSLAAYTRGRSTFGLNCCFHAHAAAVALQGRLDGTAEVVEGSPYYCWQLEESNADLVAQVQQQFFKRCILTGKMVTNRQESRNMTFVHRLYDPVKFPELAFLPENGILLYTTYAKMFNVLYKAPVTGKNFLEFLTLLEKTKLAQSKLSKEDQNFVSDVSLENIRQARSRVEPLVLSLERKLGFNA